MKILLCFPLGASGFNKSRVESKGSSASPEALSALKLCVAVREEQELLSVVVLIVFLVWEQKAVSQVSWEQGRKPAEHTEAFRAWL